jgi:hypothetical protein
MRKLIAIVALVVLALLTPGTVQVDGVARGKALAQIGALRLDVGGRAVTIGFREYRPGRVYYRLAAGVRV